MIKGFHVRRSRTASYQKHLREIAWEIGHRYPSAPTADCCVLLMVHPRLGYVYWHSTPEHIKTVSAEGNGKFKGARTVIRISDVTDIIYDGTNAHRFQDTSVNSLQGSYYFPVEQAARHYLAELGLLLPDGTFYGLLRSAAVFFERDRPAGNYRIDGLFVCAGGSRIIPVENIFDAPVFERMNREIAAAAPGGELQVALVQVNIGRGSALSRGIRMLAPHVKKFGVHMHLFTKHLHDIAEMREREIELVLADMTGHLDAELHRQHAKKPFHLIHCHDWCAASLAAWTAAVLRIPLVLSLHATEHERSPGMQHPLSGFICDREAQAARAAALVIVPHSSTRQQALSLYGIASERVVIIPDLITPSAQDAPPQQAELKRSLGFKADARVMLFAGELSHAAGADILMEALLYVCSVHGSVQFVFAGEGPLRGELEGKAFHGGVAHRCRFVGDVPRKTFEQLLGASDFVVIPSRTWQDEGLAQMAIGAGKPVLTTKQAGITCIVHGDNGLVSYDNPGSIIWGIQELLNNPLQKTMARAAARNSSGRPFADTVAAQHCTCYSMALHNRQGGDHA